MFSIRHVSTETVCLSLGFHTGQSSAWGLPSLCEDHFITKLDIESNVKTLKVKTYKLTYILNLHLVLWLYIHKYFSIVHHDYFTVTVFTFPTVFFDKLVFLFQEAQQIGYPLSLPPPYFFRMGWNEPHK